MKIEIENIDSNKQETRILETDGQLTGTVKWFNNLKGYGFIKHISGKDVFVHYSVIEDQGFKTLNEGDEVLYELDQRVKGLYAKKVTKSPNMQNTDIPHQSDSNQNIE